MGIHLGTGPGEIGRRIAFTETVNADPGCGPIVMIGSQGIRYSGLCGPRVAVRPPRTAFSASPSGRGMDDRYHATPSRSMDLTEGLLRPIPGLRVRRRRLDPPLVAVS